MICDCQKEFENEISHYRRVLGKLKKIRSICHTIYTETEVTSDVLSTSGMAVSLGGIGINAGAPMAGLAGFLGFISTAFAVGSKILLKKLQNMKKNYL